MNTIVQEALALWGMGDAHAELAAARENQVYRVDHGPSTFALRLHREGYRADAELRSELQWMKAVAEGGLHVPHPVASSSGDILHVIGGVQVDVLSWLAGRPMGKTGTPLVHKDPEGLFRAVGVEMARLHAISDAWQPPPDFTRWAWNLEGLLGEAPVWGRFWDNPTLLADECTLFREVREIGSRELAARQSSLDYGLIHADLVRENVMIDGGRVQMIDFDDGGFGYRLFDLATTLVKVLDEPDYPRLKTALLGGYRSIRPIDTSILDLLMLLRAATYVGWIADRLHEDGAMARNRRNIKTAITLAETYLQTRSDGRTNQSGLTQ